MSKKLLILCFIYIIISFTYLSFLYEKGEIIPYGKRLFWTSQTLGDDLYLFCKTFTPHYENSQGMIYVCKTDDIFGHNEASIVIKEGGK